MCLKGDKSSVKSHIGGHPHQRKLGGVDRTVTQIHLDNEIKKYVDLELSNNYSSFYCKICKKTYPVQNIGNLKYHMRSAEHKSQKEHGKSKVLANMKQNAAKTDCFVAIEKDDCNEYRYFCTVCKIEFKSREERTLSNHMESQAHKYSKINDFGETIPIFHRSLAIGLQAG